MNVRHELESAFEWPEIINAVHLQTQHTPVCVVDRWRPLGSGSAGEQGEQAAAAVGEDQAVVAVGAVTYGKSFKVIPPAPGQHTNEVINKRQQLLRE